MAIIRHFSRCTDLLGQPVLISEKKPNGLVIAINDFCGDNMQLKHAFWAWVKAINSNRPDFRCSHVWAMPQIKYLKQVPVSEQLFILNKMADTAYLTCRYDVEKILKPNKKQSFKIGTDIKFKKQVKRRYE